MVTVSLQPYHKGLTLEAHSTELRHNRKPTLVPWPTAACAARPPYLKTSKLLNF